MKEYKNQLAQIRTDIFQFLQQQFDQLQCNGYEPAIDVDTSSRAIVLNEIDDQCSEIIVGIKQASDKSIWIMTDYCGNESAYRIETDSLAIEILIALYEAMCTQQPEIFTT